MKKLKIILLTLLFLACSFSSVSADTILDDWLFNFTGDTIDPGFYTPEDLQDLPYSFDDSGFDWTTGLGRLTITYPYGYPDEMDDYFFIAYFNHSIGDVVDDEYGSGSPSDSADWPSERTWEVDYAYNEIYWPNSFENSLDFSNVPNENSGDVAMALGWDFSLAPGESAIIELLVGLETPDTNYFLRQTDGSGEIFYSGDLTISAPIPEPATMLLLGSGLIGLAGFRKRFKKG